MPLFPLVSPEMPHSAFSGEEGEFSGEVVPFVGESATMDSFRGDCDLRRSTFARTTSRGEDADITRGGLA